MKTVIEMAREAGMVYREFEDEFANANTDGVDVETLERFAEIVRAAENEACAMWAWSAVLSMTDSDTADKVLAAIRARSNT